MLTLRMIGVNDYSVREDGQRIGRIRYASERTPGIWQWHVQVHIPGPPFGDAKDIDQAKERFKAAWLALKAKHGPEALAFDEHRVRNAELLVFSSLGRAIAPAS